MAINTDFNVKAGTKAPRKLLKHFVNVGSKEAKEWELLGVGIEDNEDAALKPMQGIVDKIKDMMLQDAHNYV